MAHIQSRQDLKEFVSYEKGLYNARRASLFGLVFSEKAIIWRYISLLRREEFYINTRHRFLALLFHYRRMKIGRKYGFHIPVNCIDKGFLMYHLGFVMINASQIGRNFCCNTNVALIAGGHDGSNPTIGNNVVIGYGSTICGGVTIADGIAVGACSFVNKSFLEGNICIAGSPAKKISNNGSATWKGCAVFHENSK